MIANKIKSLTPSQIMTYFKFYCIQKQPEFYLYKNNQNYFVFIYRDTSENLFFLETITFSKHSKLSFFLFMVSNLDRSFLNTTVLDCVKIEVPESIVLSANTNRETLLSAFFNLKNTNLYKGTAIESVVFERNGSGSIVLYADEKPIDIVSFQDNDTDVYSEFGNNFGYNLQKRDSDTLVATYNPSLLISEEFSTFSIALTKFYVSYFDFISIVNTTEARTISIPTNLKYSKLYKLRIVLFYYSLCNQNIHFTFNHSANFFYVEISFYFKKSAVVKLELLNLVASFKTEFYEHLRKLDEAISQLIKEKYSFDLKMKAVHDNYVGTIVFRNNTNMLDIVISKLQGYVSANSDYVFF